MVSTQVPHGSHKPTGTSRRGLLTPALNQTVRGSRVPELQLEGGVCRAPAGRGCREDCHGEREWGRNPGFLSPGMNSEGQVRVQTGAWAAQVLQLSRAEPGCVQWEEAVVFCPLRDAAWEVCVDGK